MMKKYFVLSLTFVILVLSLSVLSVGGQTTVTNQPPTIGGFQAPSIVYAARYFYFNATINDDDGVTDLTKATIGLDNRVILKWENSTDAFTEYSYPKKYCTLDSSSSSKILVNSTALKLIWKIKLDWTYPKGSVNVVSSNTKVFDTSGAWNSNSHIGLSIFKDDLIIRSANVPKKRVNADGTFSFTGYVSYEGTSIPPANGNSALKFDGENDYVDMGSGSSLSLEQKDFTLESWIKASETNTNLAIFRLGNNEFYWRYNAIGYYSNEAGGHSGLTTLTANAWYHLVWTYNGQDLTFYVNSNNDGNITSVSLGTFGLPNYIGTWAPANEAFKGIIDEVRIYNRALSSSEIQEHYQGIYNDENGLQLYLDFDGDSDDESGHKNQCTIHGTSWTNEGWVNLDAKVELDGTLKQTVGIVKANGNFAIPNVIAEHLIGSYSYNVFAYTDEKTVQNQEVTVNVDALKVDSHRIDIGTETVYVHMVYTSDDSAVVNGMVKFAGLEAKTNVNGWAEFNMTEASDFNWGQEAYALRDAIYGITYKMQNQTLPLAKKTHLIQSDARVSGLRWDDEKLIINFAGGIGNYILKISGNRPTYILNIPYDLSTDYTNYLTLGHDGSKQITVAYSSWDDMYIPRIKQSTIQSVSWTKQNLTLTIDGAHETNETLTVYCGERGNPQATSGFTAKPTYDSQTQILTGQYQLSSQLEVTLDWTVNFWIDDNLVGVDANPRQTVEASVNFVWTEMEELTVTSVEFEGNASEWLSLVETLPKTFTTEGATSGSGSILLKLSVPPKTEPGEYVVPIRVLGEASGFLLETTGYLWISVKEPLITNELIIFLSAFLLSGVVLIAFLVHLRRRRKGKLQTTRFAD